MAPRPIPVEDLGRRASSDAFSFPSLSLSVGILITFASIVFTRSTGTATSRAMSGNSSSAHPARASADADKDGSTNAEEAAAATNPFHAILPPGHHAPTRYGIARAIRLGQRRGQPSTILTRDDLATGSWTPSGSTMARHRRGHECRARSRGRHRRIAPVSASRTSIPTRTASLIGKKSPSDSIPNATAPTASNPSPVPRKHQHRSPAHHLRPLTAVNTVTVAVYDDLRTADGPTPRSSSSAAPVA